MKRLASITLAASLSLSGLFAQTSDIVVFSEAGEKFTLVIDGDVKNAQPATRVVATGIKNATPLVVVNFLDATVPPIKQNGWMEPGLEYTLRITTNKKGVRVLRLQGQAALGTAASSTSEKPSPAHFTDDVPMTTGTSETIATDVPATMNSSTTVTTTDGTVGQHVNMNVGVNGVGMTMTVNDGMGGTTTTTTTTTTTHTVPVPATDQVVIVEDAPVIDAGCGQPMAPSDFSDAVASITDKGFDETKLTLAKQIGSSNCLTTAQVKDIMGLFGFEDSKLDFAKFAYDHVVDVNNYYKVNDAFGFSSSVDELNTYIQGR